MFDNTAVGVAFWVFIAVVAVADILRKASARREAQATIRLAIEKGQPLDAALVDKLLHQPAKPDSGDGLLFPGILLIAMGLGFPVMGVFISIGGDSQALFPLIGVGALLLFMGLAFLVTRAFVRPKTPEAGRDRSEV